MASGVRITRNEKIHHGINCKSFGVMVRNQRLLHTQIAGDSLLRVRQWSKRRSGAGARNLGRAGGHASRLDGSRSGGSSQHQSRWIAALALSVGMAPSFQTRHEDIWRRIITIPNKAASSRMMGVERYLAGGLPRRRSTSSISSSTVGLPRIAYRWAV